MRVVHFFDGNRFFSAEVPWFEWDIKGAEYLKSGAADAYNALCSNYLEGGHYDRVKAVYDQVKTLRFRFEYKSKYNNLIPECVQKGYDKYGEVLENILTRLAAELFYLNSVDLCEDEKEKIYYWDKIYQYESEALKLLDELKNGKISYTLRDGKTRTFDYRFPTSNYYDHRGILFFAKDKSDMKDFEGEVERQFFK